MIMVRSAPIPSSIRAWPRRRRPRTTGDPMVATGEGRAAAAPPRPRTATSLGRKARRNVSAHGLLIGAALCFALLSWYPMCREIVTSFQKSQLGGPAGRAGRTTSASSTTPTFWVAWRNTLEFTVLALIVGYAVPFFVAILLNELRHAKGYLPLPGLPAGDAPADLGAAALRLLLRPDLRLVQRHLAPSSPAGLAVGPVARHQRPFHGDDLGGDRGHLDEHGRRDADLPGRAAEHPG